MKKPINVMYDSGLDKLERRAIECALNLVYHLIGFKRGIIKYGNGARFGKKHLDADGYLDALLAGGRRAVSASELLDEISDQHAVNLFFTAKPFCDAKFGATNEFATVQSVLAYREGLSTEERILAIKGTLWHELGSIMGISSEGNCLDPICMMHYENGDSLQDLIICAKNAQYAGVYCQKCQRAIMESV